MRKLLFLCAGVMLLAASACGSALPYAARVNGTAITQSDLNAELHAIAGNKTYLRSVEQQLAQQGGKVEGAGRKGTFDSGFVAKVLTREVLLELVHQGLQRRHVVVKPAQLQEAEKQLRSSFGDDKVFNAFPASYRAVLVRRSAEVEALQGALSTTKVDAASIAAFYEKNKAQFSQTCVRHLLALVPQDHPATPDEIAKAKATAEGWEARLAKGEDFAAIAKAESGDPGSGAKGGDLGCGSSSQFVGPFAAAEDALAVDQISAPVQTTFGFHVIQVTSRKMKSLEEATPEIRQQLGQQDQGAFNTFLDTSIKGARVTINPRYGTFAKTGQQPGVIPPGPPPTTAAPAGGGAPADGGGAAVPGGGADAGSGGGAPAGGAPAGGAPSGQSAP